MASPLTPGDIPVILEACARANVRTFTGFGLRLEFGPGEKANSPIPSPASELTPPSEAILSEQHIIAAHELERSEASEKLDRLDQMRIENPLEYERLINTGELVDDEGDDDGDGADE